MKPILLCTAVLLFSLSTQARPTESNLLAKLNSSEWEQVKPAIQDLPAYYPHSEAGIAALRGMLCSYKTFVFTERVFTDSRDRLGHIQRVDSESIARVTVRSLGRYHIKPTEAELDIIFNQIIASHLTDTAMDGLKALREMDATNAVPRLIPLLGDRNIHVVRDTIRTLAVLGDASLIPLLEPFRHRESVRNYNIWLNADATEAIAKLKNKKK